MRPLWTFKSEEHTSELQSRVDLVCRLLVEKKKARWHLDQPLPQPSNGKDAVGDQPPELSQLEVSGLFQSQDHRKLLWDLAAHCKERQVSRAGSLDDRLQPVRDSHSPQVMRSRFHIPIRQRCLGDGRGESHVEACARAGL